MAPALPATYDTLFTSPSAPPSYDYDSLHPTEEECIAILSHEFTQEVTYHDILDDQAQCLAEGTTSFASLIHTRISTLLSAADSQRDQLRSKLLHTAYAALYAFLQSNVTGPPLNSGAGVAILSSKLDAAAVRARMIRDLSVDGEAVYKRIPAVELFVLAKSIFAHEDVVPNQLNHGADLLGFTGRMRVTFLHQKMLGENSDSLWEEISADLERVAGVVLAGEGVAERVRFMLERAVIYTHHGLDGKAREDLLRAAGVNGFEFALTGKLGRRTKFQDRDISQLVVLAKSAGTDADGSGEGGKKEPKNLDLNDDTLLESIAFKQDIDTQSQSQASVDVKDSSSLPAGLASLDAANQPRLNPLDSIILLSLASAITNTSPEDGLTREETIPYAVRVLEGGSSNWQVYSQALLVRSRIEGYRTRTVERSVLQLQALVDQVIADTASDTPIPAASGEVAEASTEQPTTFLPRPEASESAHAAERLQYIWLLNFSTRWNLESELAQRWVGLGALRTALDIYERLQMWAEAALCYAATDREETAKLMVRKQLYQRTNPDSTDKDETDTWQGAELATLPPDAPRLFCILGDIDRDAAMYERAWTVSNKRYARAQRSLARLYMQEKPPNLVKAEEAYKLSLAVTRLNHASWFAIGCIQLELEKWEDAIDSFTRTVQLEETDAEAWSNLAVALLNAPARTIATSALRDIPRPKPLDDEEEEAETDRHDEELDIYKQKRDALAALHRAARFKHTDHRIWDNILTVGASIPPPVTPFRDVLLAQTRLIELRGEKDGEKCIDIPVVTALVRTLTTPREGSSISIAYDPSAIGPGSIHAKLLRLFDEKIIPLITHSPELWLLVADLERWRGRPSQALAAHEKAWRATIASCAQGAYQMGEEGKWNDIVKATETLVRKGYAVYGGMDREVEDGSKDAEPELVAKDWRFKSRSAVRGILGKGKSFWDGNEGWTRLDTLLKEVSGH
ncbi:TPR repeat-containing protein [Nannizzia gypsea CBS 118893]|uniref:TPR repeat-containing protein n=1 Tax=Arthroderma gypseum (strain ATCC MYA-4604 / CBS 118893) TaxID=535722 RepID=E4UN72_ARTGP|nr:TPR repeat-containing protein [Nannizzia gypsea CBS 118893]EFQ99533.1 TPR repeat-containing protein [Nannizzia gypsea CBS 118893]